MNEVTNIFGDLVQAPAASTPPSEPTPAKTKYAQIPLAEMSPEEKRAYFRDRAAASRKRKREAEEKQEEAKRLEAQQNRNDSWHQREAEDNAKPTPAIGRISFTKRHSQSSRKYWSS